MTILSRWRSMVAWLWRRDRAEQGLDAELRAYVELSAADKVRDGVPPGEARRQAMLELGGIEAVKEQVRRERHGGLLDEIGRDVRYALRLLRKTPAFAGVVVVTLALGIGANTAIFSVIDALMLRWLPVRAPQELVGISLVPRDAPADAPVGTVSYAIVRMLAEQGDLFTGVGAFSATRLNVGPPDAVTPVLAAVVAGDFFGTLGLEAQAGRLLTAADDTAGAPAAVVISDGYWERWFNRSRDAIGRTLLINGTAVPIVGVSPRGFFGATVGATADLTITAASRPQIDPGTAALLQPGNFWLRVIARPQGGVSHEQLTSRLAVVWQREADRVINPRWPASLRAEVAAQVFQLSAGGTGWSYPRTLYRRPLVVLMTIVAVVLLITCANVASLLLARASARQREMALRLALGAGRGRVVRALLTEGIVLAVAGGVLGAGLAWAGGRALVRVMSTRALPIDIDVTPNLRVLAFTAAVALGTALLFAIVPALQATAAGPSLLATGARASRGRSRWLSTLVSAQVALALVLLAGASLFVRTFENLQRRDPGFDATGVLIAELDERRLVSRDLVAEIAQLPGVTAAALATHTPLSGWLWSEPFVPMGQPLPERDTALAVGAGPGYFATLRIRILAGRAFTAGDVPGRQPVAIVNERYARRFFAGRPVVGQHLSAKLGGVEQELAVVGLAADTSTKGLREASPETVYLPYAQLPAGQRSTNLLVLGQGPIGMLTRTIEPALRAAMPGTPIEIEPLASQVGSTIVQERVLAMLATGFGLVALLLTIVGLYGVIAYGVAQRTQELGVRLALGARRAQVIGLVLGDGARLVGLGIAVGLPAAWLASRWVRALLFGVTPDDPASAVAAIVVLGGAALVAAYFPARRAARTDPLVALRHD